jgi:hypothetical protein
MYLLNMCFYSILHCNSRVRSSLTTDDEEESKSKSFIVGFVSCNLKVPSSCREMLNAEASSIIIVNRVIYKKGASFGVNEKKNRGTKAERVE